jgi:hypothetical protein
MMFRRKRALIMHLFHEIQPRILLNFTFIDTVIVNSRAPLEIRVAWAYI